MIIQTGKQRAWVNIGILAVTFFSLVALIRWYKDTQVPVHVPNANIPNSIKLGNPEESVKRTQTLLSQLKAKNWNYFKVPRQYYHLPDSQMAENELMRSGKTSSYIIPDFSEKKPSDDLVAVYTDIYIRKNPAYYKGDKSRFKPEGFYIVGWRDGRVTKVSIEDVRVVKSKNGLYEVFPGTPEWKKDGMRLGYIEFADGYDKASLEARSFYRPTKSVECATCQKPKGT